MPRRLIEVLLVAFKLGLTSFGGPVAHLGYFRDEYVTRRRWLDDGAYADLVALCQVLPGPASSQVGIAVGMTRAGIGGGLAAWLGFTLPSAAAMILFGYGVTAFDPLLAAGWLRGLKVVAAAVVAYAVLGMARNLTPDRPRATLALLAAVGLLLWRTPLAQMAAIVLAGGIGWVLLKGEPAAASAAQAAPTVPPASAGKRPDVRGAALALRVPGAVPGPAGRPAGGAPARGRRLGGRGRRVLPVGGAGVRRRPRGAAPAAGGGGAGRLGHPRPVHRRLRPGAGASRDRCSRSRPTWGR